MNLVDELHAISHVLHDANVPHAICGGLAVTIHGVTRTTKDIDVLVPRDSIEQILDLVRPLGYAFASLPMTFDAGTDKERHVQRVTKVEGAEHLILDLIFAEAVFEGLLADRMRVDLPLGPITVVSKRSLAYMKRLAARPQDVADLTALGLSGMLNEDE